MQQANTNSKTAPLPLFRAEALAARQQNAQGEILLIRPFSLVFLCWLGVTVAATALGFLFLGHAPENLRIAGTIASSPEPQAVFHVPESQRQMFQPGRDLLVRCASCTQPLTGRIISVSHNTSSEMGQSGPTRPYSTVTVALPQQEQMRPGAGVEAEIQLGRKSLIAWLFEKPGP